jgi:hypothetical protein
MSRAGVCAGEAGKTKKTLIYQWIMKFLQGT